MRRTGVLMALILSVSACSPATVTGLSTSSRRVVPSGLVKPGTPASGVIGGKGGALVSDGGGSLIGNNAGSLIANNGGSLIANNGAGVTGVGPSSVAEAEGASGYLRWAPGNNLSGDARFGPGGLVLHWVGASGARLRQELSEEQRPELALSATTDAQGAFSFPNLAVVSPVLLEANRRSSDGPLRFVILPGENPLRLEEVDGALGSYLWSRLIANQAVPEAALAALTTALLTPARQAFASAWAIEPPVRGFGVETLIPAIDGWLQRHPQLVASLNAIRQAATRASQQALGAGKMATDVPIGVIHGLAATSDGQVVLVAPFIRTVWRVSQGEALQAWLGSGQRAVRLPSEGLPAAEVAIAPIGPVAVDASGDVIALVKAQSGRPDGEDLFAVVRRDNKGSLRVLASWSPATLSNQEPVALAAGADGTLTVWTAASDSGEAVQETTAGASGSDPLEGDGAQPVVSSEVVADKANGASNEPLPAIGQLRRLNQAPATPRTRVLRAWRWNLSPTTGPVLSAPVPGEESVTPLGAPPGSTFTWRLANGVFERVGLDGTVLAVGGQISEPLTADTRWVNAPDGAVWVSIGEVIYRLQGGKAVRVAGRVSPGISRDGVSDGVNAESAPLP